MGLLNGILLLAKLADVARDEAQQSRMRAAAFGPPMPQRPPGPVELAMAEACRGAATGALLLLDNVWEHTKLDGVQTRVSDREGREGSGPLAGWIGVCPGRHEVTTYLGKGVTARLPLLIHPGELFVRRLDRAAGAYVRVDDATETSVGERAGEGRLLLLDYFDKIVRGKLFTYEDRGPLPGRLAWVAGALRHAVSQIAAGRDPAELGRDLAVLTDQLDGVPLPAPAELGAVAGEATFACASQGDLGRAWLVLNLGLAVLPEEPTLLILLAELLASHGNAAKAQETLALAAPRDPWLDDAWRARAQAAGAP